jgi:hypothetical protein
MVTVPKLCRGKETSAVFSHRAPIAFGHVFVLPVRNRAARVGPEFAVDQAELCQRWQSFLAGCAAPPLMAAWNQRTLDLLTRMTGSAASRLSLKGAYRAVYGRDALSLEEAVEQRALVLPALGLMGRAERRLGGCVAVAQHLNARASTDGVPA